MPTSLRCPFRIPVYRQTTSKTPCHLKLAAKARVRTSPINRCTALCNSTSWLTFLWKASRLPLSKQLDMLHDCCADEQAFITNKLGLQKSLPNDVTSSTIFLGESMKDWTPFISPLFYWHYWFTFAIATSVSRPQSSQLQSLQQSSYNANGYNFWISKTRLHVTHVGLWY